MTGLALLARWPPHRGAPARPPRVSSAGMNAAVRAVTRMGIYVGAKVFLIYEVRPAGARRCREGTSPRPAVVMVVNPGPRGREGGGETPGQASDGLVGSWAPRARVWPRGPSTPARVPEGVGHVPREIRGREAAMVLWGLRPQPPPSLPPTAGPQPHCANQPLTTASSLLVAAEPGYICSGRARAPSASPGPPIPVSHLGPSCGDTVRMRTREHARRRGGIPPLPWVFWLPVLLCFQLLGRK